MMNNKKDCGMLIKLIADQVELLSNHELHEEDLTLSQLRYLEYLSDRSPEPVGYQEFEQAFKTSQPTVSGIVRRLLLKDLVTVAPSRQGGRARFVSLTEKGADIISDAKCKREAMEKVILSPLSEKEQEQFMEQLSRVEAHLSEEVQKHAKKEDE